MKAQTLKRTLSLVLVAVVMVASLGFAPAVYAEDADADVKVKGTGKLTAEGDGIALLAGRGTVELTGNGILWIKDVAGNATIEVKGYGKKKVFPDGWIQYSGFHGTAKVRGSRIGVIVAGVDIDLSAQGRGRVILWGHGTYEINGQKGEWKTERLGTRVKLAPTDASLSQ